MALTAHMKYGSKDSTSFFNALVKTLTKQGVFYGGDVAPVAGTLGVTVSAFKAVSLDGMIVLDDSASDPMLLGAGQTWYICLFAKYVVGPVQLEWRALSAAAYAAYAPEVKQYLIVFGVVTVPIGATEVETADISYALRDSTDTQGRSYLRGYVETVADLEDLLDVAPSPLREGDSYLVGDTFDLHVFKDGVFTRAVDVENAVKSHNYSTDRERIRRSGFSGILPSAFTNYTDEATPVSLDITNAVGGPTVSVGSLAAVVNGVFVTTCKTLLSGWAARPSSVPNQFWEGVMLEVWRETTTTPHLATFPAGDGSSLSITEVRNTADGAEYVVDADDAKNATVVGIDLLPSGEFAVVKTRVFRSLLGGGLPTFIPDLTPTSEDFAGVLNDDGSAFEALATFNESISAYPDVGSLYRALHSGASDGYSFAIPLLAVRRFSTEATANGEINEHTASGVRQVFFVAPTVKSDLPSIREGWERLDRNLYTPAALSNAKSQGTSAYRAARTLPSGFLSGLTAISGGTDSITVPECDVSFMGRLFNVPQTEVDIGAALDEDGSITLVTLEFSLEAYPARTHVWSDLAVTPREPPAMFVDSDGQRYRVVARYRVWNELSNTYETLDRLMSGAGYTRFRAHMGSTHEDFGLWCIAHSVSDTFNQRPMASSALFALSVCAVPRRNTLDWSLDPGAGESLNGGVGRPDDVDASTVLGQGRDILDLRQRIITQAEAKGILDQSFKLLLQGKLRTSLKVHPDTAEVAGLNHLYHDEVCNIGTSATAGYYNMSALPDGETDPTHFHPVIDGVRSVFSWADETQPMVIVIDGTLSAAETKVGGSRDAVGSGHVVIGVAGSGGAGTTLITVKAPLGSVFVISPDTSLPFMRFYQTGGTYISLTDLMGDVTDVAITSRLGVGATENVTEFTFKIPNGLRTDTGRHILELYVVFKGLGPDSVEASAVNRGLRAPPSAVISVTQVGRGSVLTKPPVNTFTSIFTADGTGAEAVFNLVGTGGNFRAVGLDLFMANATDYEYAQGDEPLGWEQSGLQVGAKGVLTSYTTGNNVMLGTTARVTANFAMSTMRVYVPDASAIGKAARLRCPNRISGGQNRWVEFHKNSAGFSGNYLWATLDLSKSSFDMYLPASVFVDVAGVKVSPQSYFPSIRPDVDIFLWQDTGGGTSDERMVLIPSKIGSTQVWSITGDPLRPYFTLSVTGGGGFVIADGTTIRVAARICEPITVANTDGDTVTPLTSPTTSNVRVSYLSTAYQGTIADYTGALPVTDPLKPLEGKIVARRDRLLVTTAGRIPKYLDIDSASDTTPIGTQIAEASAHNNPAPLYDAGDTADFLDVCDFGALSHHLPSVERVWTGGPSNQQKLPNGDWYRLLKHAHGQLILGGVVSADVPLSMTVPFRAGLSSPEAGDVIEHVTGLSSFASPSSVRWYDPEIGTAPVGSANYRGVYLPVYSGSDAPGATAVSGAVSFGPKDVGDYITMVAGSGIGSLNQTFSTFRKEAYAVYVGNLTLDPESTFRHNVTGTEAAGGSLGLVGVLAAYAYLLQTDSGLRMVVCTRITSSTSNYVKDRLPGEAFDVFYPHGHPVIIDAEDF